MSIEKTIPNIFLSMTASTNIIIYFFSKIKTIRGCSFLTMQCTVLHFRTYHEIKFLYCFYNKYGFCNIPEFGNNQQFRSKHMLLYPSLIFVTKHFYDYFVLKAQNLNLQIVKSI